MSDGKVGCPKGHKRSAETKAKCRVASLAKWQDPVYRAKCEAGNGLRMEKVRAARAAKCAAMFPKRGTPEGKYYRKVRDSLGAKAAREALGIGQ